MLGKGPGWFLAWGHSLSFPFYLSVLKTPFKEQVFDSGAHLGQSEGFRGKSSSLAMQPWASHITSPSRSFSSFGMVPRLVAPSSRPEGR